MPVCLRDIFTQTDEREVNRAYAVLLRDRDYTVSLFMIQHHLFVILSLSKSRKCEFVCFDML